MNPHSRLSTAFLRAHPAAAAHVLEGFPAESVAKVLASVSPVTAKYVLEHFTPGFAASCLICIRQPTAGQIFTRLLPEFQIILLRQLDRDQRDSLLNALRPELAASIQQLLLYPAGTAGTLMEAPLASVTEDLPVRDVLKRVKRIRRGMKFYIYVTDDTGRLTGVLTLHELINAQPASNIGQVMQRHIVSLTPTQSIQTVINNAYWQEYNALPVTDDNNTLLGVIHHKGMRRFQLQLAKTDAVSRGLGIFMDVGEMFSVTAAQLLAAFISTGTSLKKQNPHG